MTYLYLFVGGGLGTIARYLLSKLAKALVQTNFPVGTLITNLLACLILALILVYYQHKIDQNSWISPLLIIGFCGGFSTFSTFGNETYELIQSGAYTLAILNILISVIAGVGLIVLVRSKY